MPTLTQVDQDLLDAIGRNRNRGQQRIIAAAERAVGATWREVVRAPDSATASVWVDAVRQQVLTFADVVAGTTDAYLTLWMDTTGLATAPDIDTSALVDQHNTVEMWQESPIKRLRTLLGVKPWNEASAEARRYAEKLAVLEAAHADLYVARAVAAEVGLRWRRVPNPNACGFCRVVADRVYTSIDSIALHAYCRCNVAPWHPDVDSFRPGQYAGDRWREVLKEPARNPADSV